MSFDNSVRHNSQTPVFIVGHCSSGTSILSRLMRNYLRVSFGTESQFMVRFYRTLDWYGDLRDDRWGILLGASRKSWIDKLCGAPDSEHRLGGSLAAAIEAARQGAEIIRAHDVRETVQALEVMEQLS